MEKQIKKLVMICIISSAFQIFKCTNVLAEENNLTVNNIMAKSSVTTVDTNKIWKVTFNDELDAKTIDGNVNVIDRSTNEQLNVKVNLENNNKTLVVASNYISNRDYSLIINENVKSKHNKNLQAVFSKDFTTDAVSSTNNAKISSIEDINISIGQNDDFVLPSTIVAVMSDGTNSNVKVLWDKQLESTNNIGEYDFLGTVDGYEKKVKLTLVIKAKQNNDSNNNSNDSGNNNDESNGSEESIKTHSDLQKSLYDYLSSNENRESVMKRAIELHDGDASNTCVYFASEALRRVGLSDLPEDVCNTVTFTDKLEEMGWQKSSDLSQLLPGDICFTTSFGYGPTHTYTFMKWVDPSKYDYAYICDNQGNEYGNAYHTRNIDFATPEKEAIWYFMYKPQEK